MSKNELIQITYYKHWVGERNPKRKYFADVTHSELNDGKTLSDYDERLLAIKVREYVAKLEARWVKESEKQIKSENQRRLAASAQEADRCTDEAKAAISELESLLLSPLRFTKKDWPKIKDVSVFDDPDPKPAYEARLDELVYPEYPKEPIQSDYAPKLNILDKMISSLGKKKAAEAQKSYETDLRSWKYKCEQADATMVSIKKKKEKIGEEMETAVRAWEEQRQEHHTRQVSYNKSVDEVMEGYFKGDLNMTPSYYDLVLTNSPYPDFFPKDIELLYMPDTRILAIDYSLPDIEDFPTLKEVKFIKGELKEYHISNTQAEAMFDATVYRVALRTIFEVFIADHSNAVDYVAFNGWVDSVNKSTGKRVNSCIVSIQVKKEDFMEVNLAKVDPKLCFKSFKGVGSSKLSGMTPVQPVLKINRQDRRFVEHYNVSEWIDEGTNLAAIGWEDFEHLIREVFANEFSANGGEVKVTQASKDGGVDAVAFDPDPIRGGKIVIQAKRYTNTVGVAAVRDLFGTVMNEGATKGILVTTSDYGPDAYEFAKDKPLTLMNGANLLYLLEKHGHKAKIDIKEAKLLAKER